MFVRLAGKCMQIRFIKYLQFFSEFAFASQIMYVNVFRESKSGARRVYRPRESDFPRFYRIVFHVCCSNAVFILRDFIYRMYLSAR